MKLLRTKGRVFAALFILLVAGAGTLYWIGTGPEGLSHYPPASQSPYRLPWTAGQTYRCAQSNRGIVSHRGRERFALDFAMPVGTEVRAARGGEVILVVVRHDGHGLDFPNNRLVIRHEDGTLGNYLHLKKDGSRVKVGDRVKQGQVLAASGHVGKSMIPHLHFHVTDPERKRTLPITFSDVPNDAGIPRMFKAYTSGNVQP
jgi:murein DD-endopeptidase MepM/ murein hydrolase activator NlpD